MQIAPPQKILATPTNLPTLRKNPAGAHDVYIACYYSPSSFMMYCSRHLHQLNEIYAFFK